MSLIFVNVFFFPAISQSQQNDYSSDEYEHNANRNAPKDLYGGPKNGQPDYYNGPADHRHGPRRTESLDRGVKYSSQNGSIPNGSATREINRSLQPPAVSVRLVRKLPESARAGKRVVDGVVVNDVIARVNSQC